MTQKFFNFDISITVLSMTVLPRWPLE